MTLSITLEPDAASASVLVTVQESGAVPSAPFTLVRSDAGGVTPVRLLAGQGIATGGLVVRDAEAALTGRVAYTAAYGGGASVSATTALEVTGAVLSLPVLPQYRAAVGGVGYEATRDARSTVHQPIGRPDPVVTLSRLGTRRGTLRYLAPSRDAADGILAVYDRAAVAFLRFDGRPVADLYHVAERVGEARAVDGGTSWAIEVAYVEVTRPSAPLAGALGWTWADVARLGSWAAARDGFATWADLTAGRAKP